MVTSVHIKNIEEARGLQSVTNFTKYLLWQKVRGLTLNLWRVNLNRYPAFTEENVMNMMFRKMSLCLLLLAAMAGATARSDREREEPQPQRAPRQYEPQRDNSRNQDLQNQRGNRDAGQPARNRLSPDERRALRQQINEVGRDLYPPRR